MEVEERRRRKTLYYSGRAFILFGAWSGIKIFFWLYLNPIDWAGITGTEIPVQEHTYNLVLYVMAAFFVSIDFLFRLYIGGSAVGEGKGKKKKPTYLVVTILYMSMTVFSYSTLLIDPDYYGENIVTTIVLDASCLIALVAIIINSCKLRKLRKLGE